MFLLRQFKIASSQTEYSRHEQRPIIKFLVAEKFKPHKIYKRMGNMYGEASFSQKNVFKWSKLFKESRNSIQNEESLSRLTMVITPEMVNALILTDRRVTAEDNSELGVSIGTTHKTGHNNHVFSKLSCHWVPRILQHCSNRTATFSLQSRFSLL